MSYDLIEFALVSSTNDVAKEIKSLSQPLTVVLAKEQTAGRGRHSRTWQSKRDLGLWFSIIATPEIPVQNMPLLTFAAANSICSLLRNELGIAAEIKWPNDVLVGGKKICGILTETGTDSSGKIRVIIGIGLNIFQNEEDFDVGLNATSIQLETTAPLGIKDLLEKLMKIFEIEYDLFTSECIEKGTPKSVLKHWLDYNKTVGSTVEYEFEGQTKTGKAVGVSDEGYLIINNSDGSFLKLASGEVQVLTNESNQ